MNILAFLSADELATLKSIDALDGYKVEPTEATAKLVTFGFVRAATLSFYTTRAGRLRLLTERSLAREKQGGALASLAISTAPDTQARWPIIGLQQGSSSMTGPVCG